MNKENEMNDLMTVILAYSPWLEIGFGIVAACGVVEFLMEGR
jgi:hypothetical protein